MSDCAAAAIQRSRRELLVAICGLCASPARALVLQRPGEEGAPIELRIGFARPTGGYSIQTLPLETYLARVLAGEAARDSPPAALEVLAVTSRTFALGNRDRHRADGFDLCDETHCQVVRTATPATTRAAQATAGQVLTRNGAIASVFYSASCGGRTEIPSNVWPGADDPPYLPSIGDTACEGAPAWDAQLDAADLLRAFRTAGFRGDRIRAIRIAARNSSGRVARLILDGLTPIDVSGQDFRVIVGRTLGWQHVKSTAFGLRQNGSVYRFSGHGSGHGVGLCVIGATKLAARGITAPAILAKYFPGADISTAAPRPGPPASGVLVSLPDGDEGERASIGRLVIQARDELSNALGVSPPPQIILRFHPTMDDYEKATGRPWFTTGVWVNDELHLLPVAILRERGVLERTIRHELVHAMTDVLLGQRAAWVREGAAIYFGGPRPIPGEAGSGARTKPAARSECPQDVELLRPISVGALADAYARAHACFARQIAAGRNWREVK